MQVAGFRNECRRKNLHNEDNYSIIQTGRTLWFSRSPHSGNVSGGGMGAGQAFSLLRGIGKKKA